MKVIAITDLNGELLGVVRGDVHTTATGDTIQAVPVPSATQKHHTLEVSDDLFKKPAHEVRRHLAAAKH